MKISLSVNPEQIDSIVPSELMGQAQKEAAQLATTSLLAIMKSRIFNDEGSKNSENNPIGKYSTSYLLTRETKERRTNTNINFVFTGETSRDFTLGVNDNGDFCIGFNKESNGQKNNPNAAQKSDFIDEKYGEVFLSTDEEIDLWMDIFEEELFDRI